MLSLKVVHKMCRFSSDLKSVTLTPTRFGMKPSAPWRRTPCNRGGSSLEIRYFRKKASCKAGNEAVTHFRFWGEARAPGTGSAAESLAWYVSCDSFVRWSVPGPRLEYTIGQDEHDENAEEREIPCEQARGGPGLEVRLVVEVVLGNP